MKDLTVFVKYCGGCNPRFDRSKAIKEIEKYVGFKIEPYTDEVIPDIMIIIQGCKSECIIADDYKSKMKTLMINEIENLKTVTEEIQDLLSRTEHKYKEE